MVKLEFFVEEKRLVKRELDIPEGELVLLAGVKINGSDYSLVGCFRGFTQGCIQGSNSNGLPGILIAHPYKIALDDDVCSEPKISRVRSKINIGAGRVYEHTLNFQTQVFQGEEGIRAYFTSLGREYYFVKPVVEKLKRA